MSEWKKAEECLPDETDYFLVAIRLDYRLEVCDCLFEKTKGQFGEQIADQWFPIEDVIYWMPLPKLPSE